MPLLGMYMYMYMYDVWYLLLCYQEYLHVHVHVCSCVYMYNVHVTMHVVLLIHVHTHTLSVLSLSLVHLVRSHPCFRQHSSPQWLLSCLPYPWSVNHLVFVISYYNIMLFVGTCLRLCMYSVLFFHSCVCACMSGIPWCLGQDFP